MDSYYGIKKRMTQAWDKDGTRFPISIIKTSSLTVIQNKTAEVDGYSATQVGFGKKRKHNKPMKAHLLKSKSSARYLRELKSEPSEMEVGSEIRVSDILSVGDVVTVRGVSKGRGFAGVIKRWGFAGGPRTHGQSDRERAPGSIGQGTDPGRVHKGKKMPGRFGNQQFSIRSLKIVKMDNNNGEVWITGPVPGSIGSMVKITKTGEFEFDGLFHEKVEAVKQVEENSNEDKDSKDESTLKEVEAVAEKSEQGKDSSAKKKDTTKKPTEGKVKKEESKE